MKDRFNLDLGEMREKIGTAIEQPGSQYGSITAFIQSAIDEKLQSVGLNVESVTREELLIERFDKLLHTITFPANKGERMILVNLHPNGAT